LREYYYIAKIKGTDHRLRLEEIGDLLSYTRIGGNDFSCIGADLTRES
jgi:hypothetical protein